MSAATSRSRLEGDRAAIVPERVERVAHLRRRRSGDEDVAVAIVELVVPVVVAVLVVASAGNPDRIVDEQQLVVHALVDLQEAAQDAGGKLERRRARLVEGRVVDAQFEIHMRAGQRGIKGRIVEREQLVDDDAHLDAAPRRLDQLVDDQVAGVVLGEDESLYVDAAARAADQVHTQRQRVGALLEQVDVMHRRGRRRLLLRARRQFAVGRIGRAGVRICAGQRTVLRGGGCRCRAARVQRVHGAGMQPQHDAGEQNDLRAGNARNLPQPNHRVAASLPPSGSR